MSRTTTISHRSRRLAAAVLSAGFLVASATPFVPAAQAGSVKAKETKYKGDGRKNH